MGQSERVFAKSTDHLAIYNVKCIIVSPSLKSRSSVPFDCLLFLSLFYDMIYTRIIIIARVTLRRGHESSAELIVHCYDTRVANVPIIQHYPAISDPAPAPAAIILRQTISNISHLAPLVSWQYLDTMSPITPATWPASTPRLFVSPRTEKYRHRK